MDQDETVCVMALNRDETWTLVEVFKAAIEVHEENKWTGVKVPTQMRMKQLLRKAELALRNPDF